MSMKEELEIWVTALERLDAQQYDEAITVFEPIADTSKILFNCGVIRATLGEHETAVSYFQRATALDQYMAVAYFQQGVSNFLLGDFEEALSNFNDALLYLRGNKFIDYEQLGLKYKLWACEVIFNRGLAYLYLQAHAEGMADFRAAQKEKTMPEHDVIDDAIDVEGKDFTVFCIPVGTVFRPNVAKIKNIQARDYLGKARLIRQASQDAYHRRQMSAENWAKDDRPADKLSYAATNLVRPNLRSRQQSEPPINRNYFPPTPPPEIEKERPRRAASPDRASTVSRPHSLSRPKPEPLNLGATSFNATSYGGSSQAPARIGTTRSASERPSARRPYLERKSTDESVRSNSSTRHKLFGSVDHTEGQNVDTVAAQMQESTISPKSNMAARQRQQTHDLIEEEEEEYVPFDIRSSMSTIPTVRDDTDNISTYSRRSRRGLPTMSKIRAKVHANDDTRYIMVQPKITIIELLEQVARKFGISTGVKLKTQDEEGDMITMADQDDLDMAISMCKEVAAKERADMGKIELWVQTA